MGDGIRLDGSATSEGRLGLGQPDRGRHGLRLIAILGGIGVIAGSALAIQATHRPSMPGTSPENALPLTVGTGYQINAVPSTRTAAFSFDVTNRGTEAIALSYSGHRIPHGFALGSIEQAPPMVLPPGASGRLTVTVRVIDCAAVPTGASPLFISVRAVSSGRWQDVQLLPPAAPSKGGWEQEVANSVCGAS